MKSRTRTFATAAMASAMLALSAPATAEEIDITLLLVSDIYTLESNEVRGGFSRAAAVARSEKFFNDNVLYIHAGHTISPSLMSGIDSGAHVMDILNVYPPDVFVPGNRDFDFGPEVFEQRFLQELNSEVFGANIRDSRGNRVQGITDARVFDFDGVKIGVFGMLSADTFDLVRPGPDYRLLPIFETARQTSAALRHAGADIVVAVSHSRFAEDELLYKEGAMDVLLSGYDQDLKVEYNGNVVFAETREEGEFLVAVDLKVEFDEFGESDEISWWPNWRIIDTRDYDPDPETESVVQRHLARLADEYDRDIGTTLTALDTRHATMLGGEAAFGNLVSDVIRDYVDADVGLTNGGAIRGNRQYPANTTLTRRDIFDELPFGNVVVKLRMKGSVLLEALEHGVSRHGEGHGGFLQVSGIAMTVDLGRPAGSRVAEVTVNGEPLDFEKEYTVATNEYLAGGGDGYAMFADEAEVLLDGKDTMLVPGMVVEHIRQKGSVAPVVEGRIRM